MNTTNTKFNRIMHWITLLPLMLLLAVVPSLVRLIIMEDPLYSFGWTDNNLYEFDLYLYCKNRAIIFLGAVMIILLIIELLRGTIQKHIPYAYLLIGIYALLAIGSTILSNYRSLSLNGIPDHFESIWVLLSYCTAVFYAFLIIKEESDLHWLFGSLGLGTLFIGIVGISQAIGHNLYELDWVIKLIMPAKYLEQLEGFSFNTDIGVSASLYNPNYVGVYGALVIPVLSLCIFAYFKYKNKLKSSLVISFFYLVSVGILGYITLKSQSAAAALSLAGTVALFLLILYIKFWKKLPIRISGIVIIIGIVIAGVIKIPSMLSNIKSGSYDLTDITTAADYVSVTYKGETLHFSISYTEEDDAALSVTDSNGTPVNLKKEDFSYKLENNAFSECEAALLPIDNYMSLYLILDEKSWIFSNEVTPSKYLLLNDFGNWVEISTPASAVFTNYTNLATNRGYIWSRTIPLLSQSLILGTGPDTFATIFPQYDYVGRLNTGYTTTDIFTKPHNLYLQIGIQTGVLSLLCILVFYILYFIKSIKIYSSISYKGNLFLCLSGLGLFLGTFSYMIAGLANDSMILFAPVFWIILGLGMKINQMITQEEDIEEEII